jgi:hypothetical protein
MQQVECPGCGAPVQFKSSASVMAVCGFCQSTVLKDAGSVADLGKMSTVLEDYSPLQIGTSGQYQQRSFSLIGRIQLQYSEGFWNEWYALFDDGTAGWLSDASGQYAITFLKPAGAELPLFQKLAPGRSLTLFGHVYTTSDVRTAECRAGQGELPFKVSQGWVARVADFRAGDQFLSLDYSDPVVRTYLGQAVELGSLKPQLLRDADAIKDAAGRFRGKVSALSCPSCGAPVKCVPGITVHFVCPSCHSEVDTTGEAATVLAAGAAVETVHFTLALGSEASINGARYTVLGAMRRGESDGSSAWSEYLLYAPGRKFIWLVETDEGWQQSEVLDRWPLWDGAGRAVLDGQPFNKASEYAARVLFAAGSFNWRVSVGDVARVTEFAGGTSRLAAEITAEELTWSRSSAVALDQIRAYFGSHVQADQQPHPKYTATARRLVVLLLAVNAIPILLVPGACLTYTVIAAIAIYLPALFLDRLDAEAS